MQTLLFEMFMYNYSPWIKWALKLCANPLWMKYLILRFSANSTMAHLSIFKSQNILWITQQWVSLKKHTKRLLLTLWICKPPLANNVELGQIVNHETWLCPISNSLRVPEHQFVGPNHFSVFTGVLLLWSVYMSFTTNKSLFTE